MKIYIRTLLFSVCALLSFKAFSLPEIPTIPPIPDIVSQGETYHVNNLTGSNRFDGDSVEKPWRSLKYAIKKISAGDTVIVHGTAKLYADTWLNILKSGSENQWITIKGKDSASGERPVFKHRMSFGNKYGKSTSYIALENIDFKGGGASGLNMVIYPGSHHLVFEDVNFDCEGDLNNSRAVWTNENVQYLWFRNLHVQNCGYARDDESNNGIGPTDCGGICIKAQNIDEVVFENVKASNNVGDGLGGDSNTSYGNIYFKGCISENNTGDGFDIGGNRVVVVNSIARNNGGHQGVGFKLWSKDSWVVNSVAYNNEFQGIRVNPRHTNQNDAYVLNSTIASNNVGRYGGQIGTHRSLPSEGELKLYLHNNIFYALNTSAVLIDNINIQSIQSESNNYYFSYYDSTLIPSAHWAYKHAVHIRDGNYNFVKGYLFKEMEDGEKWSLESGLGTGNIGQTKAQSGKTDPGFMDLSGGDLHLDLNSDAIDAGIDTGATEDLDGDPIVDTPDIGAYEYLLSGGDGDDDSDGIANYADNCPNSPNPLQSDIDADSIGNVCDLEQLVFLSEAGEDGWLTESREASGIGGKSYSGKSGSTAIRIGDNRSDKRFKSIVSFDTSSLTADHNIQAACLELTEGGVKGNVDPFGTAWVDVSANGFGGDYSLSPNDYEAQPDLADAGYIINDGTVSVAYINDEGLTLLQGTSKIQMRIAFEHGDNDNNKNDYVGYYSADNSNAAKHPRLVILYTLPDE